MKAAPIVKWAGGKRQLLDELLARTPGEFGAYHEFFLGGGALFFELCAQGKIEEAYLSDVNPKLMNVYEIVKHKPYELLEELKCGKYRNDEATFYKIRENEPEDTVQKAARFIYLNKTAFNGLYRENSTGKFNVPFGRYSNPKIANEDGILEASEALAQARLLCGDFTEILKHAKKGDFAYFDPPYVPLTKTASFTAYTAGRFGPEDQARLKMAVDKLVDEGVRVLLSNSETPFVAELYAGYEQVVVSANRMINCQADKRGKIRELLVVAN